MKLRPYQTAAVESTLGLLRAGSSSLGLAATGLGKTIMFAETARRWPSEKGRVLVIAHTEELVDQSIEKIERITGERPAKEMGEWRANEHPSRRRKVVVASVQSLNSSERMKRFEDIGMIVVDEAHRGVAPMYRNVYDHFRDTPRLGVTATPDRLDEESLGQIFDEVAFCYDLPWAVKNGWLVPIVSRCIHCDGLDLSKCRKQGQDLSEIDVMEAVKKEAVIHQMAHGIEQTAKGRRTIVFMPSGFKDIGGIDVRVSQLMCDVLNRRKPDSARWVMGHTHKDERHGTIRDFRDGKFQFLVNVDVLTEGFDDPGIECVAICRPTMSRAKYSQMVGRGTRALAGVIDDLGDAEPSERHKAIEASAKPLLEVIDFVGNTGRHRLVSAADILGGNHSERAIQRVRERVEQGEPIEIATALDDEEAQIALEKRREVIADANRFVIRTVDPFDVLGIEPKREYGWDRAKQASAAQMNMLKSLGYEGATRLSRGRARQLIGDIMERRSAGKADYRQALRLRQRGLSADVSVLEAAAILGDPLADRVKSLTQRWKSNQVATT